MADSKRANSPEDESAVSNLRRKRFQKLRKCRALLLFEIALALGVSDFYLYTDQALPDCDVLDADHMTVEDHSVLGGTAALHTVGVWGGNFLITKSDAFGSPKELRDQLAIDTGQ